jgi:hypothetical protein
MRIIKVIAIWPDMKFNLGDEIICPKGLKIIPNKSGNQYDYNPIDPDEYPHLFETAFESKEPLDMLIIDIPSLSIRARNAIHAASNKTPALITISDAASITMDQYKRFRNTGKKTLEEIINVTKAFGYQIK